MVFLTLRLPWAWRCVDEDVGRILVDLGFPQRPRCGGFEVERVMIDREILGPMRMLA
jgi:hypothetical protein